MTVTGAAALIDFLKRVFDAVESSAYSSRTEPCVRPRFASADATWRRAVDAGATPLGEPANMFYGDRGAAVKDASGNTWWIATHIEDVAPKELQRRRRGKTTDVNFRS